ncbi:MAG: hypothetical protein RSF68_01405 [Myroides sp.]
MNKKLFKKFEEKKILEESSVKILGGGPTWPGNDYSAETGDNDSTANGTDCGDGNDTDVFTDAVPTHANSDGPEPSTGVGLFPRP